MRDGIDESVASGWCGEGLGTESAADYSASVRGHLIANVIGDFVSGQFTPDSFRIKKSYLAMLPTSQFAAAVVPQDEGYVLHSKRKNILCGTNTDAQRIAYTSL